MVLTLKVSKFNFQTTMPVCKVIQQVMIMFYFETIELKSSWEKIAFSSGDQKRLMSSVVHGNSNVLFVVIVVEIGTRSDQRDVRIN